MKEACLVTIVDSISTTSIPVNEFVLYRNRTRKGYRQIIISRTDTSDCCVFIPEDIDVYRIPSNLKDFRMLLKRVLNESKKKNEEVIFHLHHQKSALRFIIASLFMGTRRRSLFTIHSFYSNRNFLYGISSIVCSLWANYANCVSQAALDDYPLWVRMIKGKRMTAIHNGIDETRIKQALDSVKYADKTLDMRRMVCVDRIIPIKNQAFLIGLMKRLPDMKLVLVGKESENYDMRSFASREGVEDRVEFTGLLPRDKVYKVIRECGLYVSASKVEGLHLSVLEAISAGAIPLISDIPAHREIAQSCDNMFEPLSFEENAWVNKITEIRQTDKGNLKRMSAILKEKAIKRFSLQKMHESYDAIYADLIQS